MDNAIEHLFDQFEEGKLTRRDLARGLAAVSTAAVATSMLSEGSVAEAGTGGLEDWQQALLEGVANLHFKIPSGTTNPVIDGGEPFSSAEHWDWLFKTPKLTTDKDCLKSPLRSQIRQAVKDVPKKGGSSWNIDPGNRRAANILDVLNNMDVCRATDDNNTRSILYDLIKLKINHAEEHGREDGMLDMAAVVYNKISDATCKSWIIKHGSEYYFNGPGHETEFRNLLMGRPHFYNSHDW